VARPDFLEQGLRSHRNESLRQPATEQNIANRIRQTNQRRALIELRGRFKRRG